MKCCMCYGILYFITLDYTRSTEVVQFKTTKTITVTEGTPHQTLDANISISAIITGNRFPIIFFFIIDNYGYKLI
jgi:hypothetical protein